MTKEFAITGDPKIDSKSTVSFTTHDGTEHGQTGYPGTLIDVERRLTSGAGLLSEASIRLSADDAAKAAVQWLKDLGRQDLLAPEPYVPLAERVGQYVQQFGTHYIRRIVGPAVGTTPGRDYAMVEGPGGTPRHMIFNGSTPDEIWWTPVEVEVTFGEEKWEVVK